MARLARIVPAALAIVLLCAWPLRAKDLFPKGCVDCHVVQKDGTDARFTTLSKQWAQQVSPALMAKIKPIAPKGATLKGKHPPLGAALLNNVPASCAKCHTATSKAAPALAPMIHAIHFVGEKNIFVTKLGGECRHCHKFDASTASWIVPSGAAQ